MRNILIVLLALFTSYLFSLDIDSIIKHHTIYKLEESAYTLSSIKLNSLKVENYPLTGSFFTSVYGSLTDPSMDFYIGTSTSIELLNNSKKEKLLITENDIEKQGYHINIIYGDLKYQLLSLILQCLYSKDYYNHTLNSYTSIAEYTKKVNSRFDKADLSRSENFYANSVLLKNRAKLIESEFNLDKSKELFKRFSKEDLTDSMGINELELINDGELSNIILDNRVKFKYNNIDLSNMQIQKDFIYKNSIPKVNLSTSFRYPFSNSSWQVNLSITYPIFGLHYDRLKEKEIDHLISNKKTLLDFEKRENMDQLDSIRSKINLLNKQLKIYRDSLELSNESLKGVLLEAKVGVRTVFDVINAQQAVFDNELLILDNNYDIYKLKIDFMYLRGDFYE